MANERMDEATQRVPPDKAAKNTKTSQTGATNKAEKVKKDELIDDRFQATTTDRFARNRQARLLPGA
jgi:hypothetical protein